jgi:hypothetical protein
MVQSTHGTKGNFELVVPPPIGSGLTHLWRNNDASGLPWNGVSPFGVEIVNAVDLIQGNFGTKGNLELVAQIGSKLVALLANGQESVDLVVQPIFLHCTENSSSTTCNVLIEGQPSLDQGHLVHYLN